MTLTSCMCPDVRHAVLFPDPKTGSKRRGACGIVHSASNINTCNNKSHYFPIISSIVYTNVCHYMNVCNRGDLLHICVSLNCANQTDLTEGAKIALVRTIHWLNDRCKSHVISTQEWDNESPGMCSKVQLKLMRGSSSVLRKSNEKLQMFQSLYHM